ncbi:hypothetical protein BDW74DRAFT_172566 [Aspergillus multicolor]|uniref:uncharacterized protein n=1 Tax=Aspergillus multicolor TaxID=41759 RepID=UPI003CCDD1E9
MDLSSFAFFLVFSYVHAQNPTGTPYTDSTTKITFSIWSISPPAGSALKFGLTLPQDALTTDSPDLIGYLDCPTSTGWCGISLGGAMTDSLLLVAYADGGSVKYTLRYTSEYKLPEVYEGNATVSPIHDEMSEDGFSSIFHCKECLRWKQGGREAGAKTSKGQMDLAYALSTEKPSGASGCADEAVLVQHNAQGTWLAFIDEGATSERFEEWAGLGREGENGC